MGTSPSWRLQGEMAGTFEVFKVCLRPDNLICKMHDLGGSGKARRRHHEERSIKRGARSGHAPRVMG